MPIFKITNGKAKRLQISPISKERQIQRLVEQNLDEILNIYFLASEYSTTFGGRMDTLGIDKNGAPVIIEYKQGQNDNVINQGLSYLKWLLDHKAEFEKLVYEKLPQYYNSPISTYNGEIHEKNFIDWDSPRVICIAESYNKFDIDTADLLPIKIELLKYSFYGDDLLSIDSDNYQKVKISISSIVKNKEKGKEEHLQKEYTVDYHLKHSSDKIKALFLKLREKIMSLDEDIKEEPKKLYIAYKMATNFADVEVRKADIKVFLNVKSGTLTDGSSLARDLTKPKAIGHWGNGDYEVKIKEDKELGPLMNLIEQSYSVNK